MLAKWSQRLRGRNLVRMEGDGGAMHSRGVGGASGAFELNIFLEEVAPVSLQAYGCARLAVSRLLGSCRICVYCTFLSLLDPTF